MKKQIVWLLLLALLLAGCSKNTEKTAASQSGSAGTSAQAPATTRDVDVSALFSDRDFDTEYEKYATVTLDGTRIHCESSAVQISGTTVTITDEGTYVLKGTLDDGMIIVDAAKTDKTQLVLDGAAIHSDTSAPIYVRQADKVFITLAAGSENTLSCGHSYEAIDSNNIDGAIFSKEDLTLNGTGSLSVSSPAGHGIVSKNQLTITGGTYDITTASHGIAGKDDLCIAGGNFAIAAGKDGLHAENNDDASLGYVYIQDGSFTVSAEGDGISAAAWMQIDAGTFDITTGGGSENGSKQTSDAWGGMGGGMGPGGMRPGKRTATGTTAVTATTTEDSTSIKGLKAGGELVIRGGSFTLDCADDGIHANSNLTVAGGTFRIATGDDGLHADDTLTFSGGTATITESYEGLEGLHIRFLDGDVTLTASDDGFNAAGGTDQSGFGGNRGDVFGGMGHGRMSAGNGSIVISGGKVSITASGDGIDANGYLEITGGHTTVCGPTSGDTATLDYDTTATISGGTFIGTGASGMAQSFSDSKQGVIALSVGNQAAGTGIRVTDPKGNEILTHTPALNFAVVILSTPDLTTGQTYTVEIGSATGDFTAN